MEFFEAFYQSAKELRQYNKRPVGPPPDFSVVPVCLQCEKLILEGKPLRCSGCQGAIFCSKTCHTHNWKYGSRRTPPHSTQCASYKRHMQRFPVTAEIISQFPWGRIEKDGSSNSHITRAVFDVLGGEGFGYWSIPGGFDPHLRNPNSPEVPDYMRRHMNATPTYQHGYPLLANKHLTEEKGWKLEERLIPHLVFGDDGIPTVASDATIVDWNTWYTWRKLSKESPAALLMHYPLTVYQLLVHVLNVARPGAGRAEKRQKVTVHYLGAEVELNFIPLFAELALLLPFTDIKVVFFGVAVRDILTTAKRKHPKSLAAQAALSGEPIYAYTAPETLGGSTLRCYLHGERENWDPSVQQLYDHPAHVLVAPNAGLTVYPSWRPVVQYCTALNLPFGVTDHAEQSVEEYGRAWVQAVLYAPFEPKVGAVTEQMKKSLARKREYPIELNPFHCPGRRAIAPFRVPDFMNGFTFRVVGKEEGQSSDEKSGLADQASGLGKNDAKYELDELD